MGMRFVTRTRSLTMIAINENRERALELGLIGGFLMGNLDAIRR